MPSAPKRACPVCRRVGCTNPAHKRVVAYRKLAKRPQMPGERARRKAAVDTWVAEHGWICPGDARLGQGPHRSQDLTADHMIPYAVSGREDGPLRVLCRSCNSRLGRMVQLGIASKANH